jgi:hypothetical protein
MWSIRRAAAVLRERDDEAAQLRTQLGFASRPGQNAIDVFAMREPLSAEAEKRWDEVMEQVERERRDPTFSRARD